MLRATIPRGHVSVSEQMKKRNKKKTIANLSATNFHQPKVIKMVLIMILFDIIAYDFIKNTYTANVDTTI